MRLDEYLIKNKLVTTRNKGLRLINENKIMVNQCVVNKKNHIVKPGDNIEIISDLSFVSRAGNKLEHAINNYNIDVNNKIVLDVGCSSGGFSDVCLQKNAKLVYCLDVNSDQLDQKIKNNKKVINLSPLNIKDLNNEHIKESLDLIVSDLSFISSYYMFSSISKLNLNKNVDIISLIKPQFELNKIIVGKNKGLIKNEKHHQMAIENVKKYANNFGFKMINVIESPILGAKKGNKEFLGWFKRV